MGRRVLVLLVLWGCVATLAQPATVRIEVLPPEPTTEHAVTVRLSGTWRNTCVPSRPTISFTRKEGENIITIATFGREGPCRDVATPWELTVPLGWLDHGTYDLIVTYKEDNVPAQVIGTTKFSVQPVHILKAPEGGYAVVTDGDGKFNIPVPELEMNVEGRIVDETGWPIRFRKFTFFLIAKREKVTAIDDLVGFVFTAPEYLKTRVTEFRRVDHRTIFLGDIRLLRIELRWSADRRLTWDDFQGQPPKDPGQTTAVISLSLSWEAKMVASYDYRWNRWVARADLLTTYNMMDRSKSWVLPEGRTPEALNHEQGHFDINEVYRRILDRELRRAEASAASAEEAFEELKRVLTRIAEKVRRKRDEVQELYDRETKNGQDLQKQREWDMKIREWLADPSRAPQP